MAAKGKIEVLTCGSKVSIGTDIVATIVAIVIEDKLVSYRVTWWSGRNRQEEVVSGHEVDKIAEASTQKIGFR